VVGVILPLDYPTAEEALELVDLLADDADFYKVGLELYTSAGPAVVRKLRGRGKRVFLDLKLHDIPNTVRRAVQAAVALDVELLTVHASGGASMLRAARDAADGRVGLLAVTVLTSLTGSEIEEVWGREIHSIRDEVARLAELSVESGVDGVVCSVLEAAWLRRVVPDDFLVVTPGIRPAGADRQDQSRVATPADAVASGSDFLIVGRPVTRAADPRAALAALLAEISSAQGS